MKAILAIAATFFATSAFAATETITCANNSNSDLQMDILVDTSTQQILGAALYNVDWSQNPEQHFIATKAVGTVDPMFGYNVILQDNQTVDIQYSVFEKGHNGSVVLNSQDDYHCY